MGSHVPRPLLISLAPVLTECEQRRRWFISLCDCINVTLPFLIGVTDALLRVMSRKRRHYAVWPERL